jgi:MFS transporter, DHA3 family, macrolide efflux protein
MRYLRLLGRGETLALWAGQVTSVMGDRLYAMAVLWLVLKMTGSTQLMAVVALGQTVPLVIVGLLGGSLVDHWDKFRGMVWIDVLRAAMVALLPIDYLLGALAPWHFLVVGIGLGSLEALFTPSLQASLPAVVEGDDLQGRDRPHGHDEPFRTDPRSRVGWASAGALT